MRTSLLQRGHQRHSHANCQSTVHVFFFLQAWNRNENWQNPSLLCFPHSAQLVQLLKSKVSFNFSSQTRVHCLSFVSSNRRVSQSHTHHNITHAAENAHVCRVLRCSPQGCVEILGLPAHTTRKQPARRERQVPCQSNSCESHVWCSATAELRSFHRDSSEHHFWKNKTKKKVSPANTQICN